MLFPASITLSLVAIFPWCASASMRPWELTRLSVSGLPWRGEEGLHEPLNTLAVEVRDPNEYAISEPVVQCITKFPYASPPYHQAFNCTKVPYGRWDFAFFPPNPPQDNAEPQYWNPGQDFTLELRLFPMSSSSWFGGQVNFSVSAGGNLRGLCSAGGVCSFMVKEEMLPVYVQQKEG
ncbi:hypothetical protein B0T18DRAFT_425543 [Schizothecium vesticola]|uniref:Ubiquitin 3 binding protein But2 C-terminal domain-containing protein n=1 Tax=Schizothecium vesticola TaxID=314040 RepID=A0AA40F3X8_9PEZI|nr:hypothetical protein B0T18DRAFT_425543 [Schizothecium vesticola]